MASKYYRQQDSNLAKLTRRIRLSGASKLRETFYCPILHVEERTELCKGHVLPQAVGGRDWVVQRKDVDNFFGSFAEAGFSHGVKLRSRGFDDSLKYMLDKGLAGRANLSVTDSLGIQRQVRPTKWKGDALGFMVPAKNGDLDLMNPVSMSFAMDVRYETLLACVHSLHLGIFRESGYRYVHSPTGEFNAALLRNVYRRFSAVRSRRSFKKKNEILEQECATHLNMVRPVVGNTDGLHSQLLSDPFRWFTVCWDEAARTPFATIHFLKAENEWNGIMSYMRTDLSAMAMICSAVPISFKVTLGRLLDDRIEIGPLRENTPQMVWPCGDDTNSQVPCPIELAVRTIRDSWSQS